MTHTTATATANVVDQFADAEGDQVQRSTPQDTPIVCDKFSQFVPLPTGRCTKLNPMDVYLGRGRGSHEGRCGNRMYKRLIMKYRDMYVNSGLSSKQKAGVISAVVLAMRHKGGWFVEPDGPNSQSGTYLGREKARKKISDDFKRTLRKRRAVKPDKTTKKGR